MRLKFFLKYIRKCILERTYPQLMLMSKHLVLDAVPVQDFVRPHFTRRQTLGPGAQAILSPITLWDLEGFFSVTVISASSISSLDADQVNFGAIFKLKYF